MQRNVVIFVYPPYFLFYRNLLLRYIQYPYPFNHTFQSIEDIDIP